MMGQHVRSEALFYYFRLDDQVPENHLLRLIEKHISFAFVRERLKDSYSETGRPSIDPELLLRILLMFEEIVARCLKAGLVRGDDLSVDGGCREKAARLLATLWPGSFLAPRRANQRSSRAQSA